jgi:hypothetical protein
VKLIQSNGQPIFGVLPESINEMNYLDYDLRTPMDKKRSALAKRFALNQFQFIGLNTPDLMVGIAIVDLKLVANAFVYCFDKTTGAFEEFSFLSPLAIGAAIEASPNHGKSYFRQGKNHFEIEKKGQQRQVSLVIADKLNLNIDIDESQYGSTPMMPFSLCSRAGYQGWVFTQKANALPTTGAIRWREKHYDLGQKSLAGVDWSGGYMRRETAWNWASLSCFLADGRRLGFNLAAGVNETGTSENVLWLDDKAVKVDMVKFDFERYQPDQAWTMQSADGLISLSFQPAGRRCEKINAGLIASNFVQNFGRFYGQIHLPQETIKLDGQWGFSEDHYAKW